MLARCVVACVCLGIGVAVEAEGKVVCAQGKWAGHVCMGKMETCGAGQGRGDLLTWGRGCGSEQTWA